MASPSKTWTSNRPPTEASQFTTNYLAVRALKKWGTESQKERIARRIEVVRNWVHKTSAKDTEDRVFRLYALQIVGEPELKRQPAIEALLQSQRRDGGWGQLDALDSDAYATGSALVALHQAGGLATCDPAYQRGIAFLLKSQQQDGSWHVRSRSKPFQPYYETGFPHGKDQFISSAASSWATTALVLSSQDQKQPAKKDEAKSIIGTIERLDPRFDQLIPKDAQMEKIAEGYIWTEGAVWFKPDKCLLFSDIPNNVVIKWEPGKGTAEFLKPSGYTGAKPRGGKAGDEPGSNGLSVDAQGRLHLCEHGDRRVTRIEKDGKKTVLADNYMGKRLNSPNDLAMHPNGDIYFTDPPYGLAKGDKRELDFTGVFRISGKDGTLSLVSKSLNPNGIALAPDLKKLYVTNGGSWMVFPVNEDGTTREGKLFVNTKQWKLTQAKVGGLDGMKCDVHGNLFATGPGGVCVIAPDGTLLGRLLTGDRTANLCFGGEDGQTLFVCVNHRIGMVRTTTKGIGW